MNNFKWKKVKLQFNCILKSTQKQNHNESIVAYHSGTYDVANQKRCKTDIKKLSCFLLFYRPHSVISFKPVEQQ